MELASPVFHDTSLGPASYKVGESLVFGYKMAELRKFPITFTKLTTFINGGNFFSILLSVFKFAWLASFGLKYSFETSQPNLKTDKRILKLPPFMKVVYDIFMKTAKPS